MRRRLAPPRRPRDDDARVLPLINVVFLLLIFFMVAGRLTASDLFQIEPPAAERGGELQRAEPTVLLAADGRLALDGTEVALADLTVQLRDRALARVRLKADAGTQATRVVEVMRALHAAGIGTVRLLTVPAPS
jgi:biopolymer transport protein ExbD